MYDDTITVGILDNEFAQKHTADSLRGEWAWIPAELNTF